MVVWRNYKGPLCFILLLLATNCIAQISPRQSISLNEEWLSIATANDEVLPEQFFKKEMDTKSWKQVNVPHNWDAYEGYRRLLHGNRHGDAWYRKQFSVKQTRDKKRFFLFFEGVGSYATVYLNGVKVGEHAGGRTSFTIDITKEVKTDGTVNLLAVRAWHPSNIKDLPWVCGGCSDERGFSEGSQPMGIFRPVHLLITNEIRIQPFGVHAWAEINNDLASLSVNTTLKNFGVTTDNITVTHQLKDQQGKIVTTATQQAMLGAGDSITLLKKDIKVNKPELWSVENPYLYTIVSTIKRGKVVLDQQETPFGFRTINWKSPSKQFLLNGKPVFINGVAEYEHLIGQSHAFSKEQIRSRMNWLQSAGFNAFRDGHQPHNLLYGQLCDQKGILWWTQLSAHVWYDSPAFRENFKALLKEWVIERRNEPSVILWGLQNESKLPEDFARECTELIRQLDPTASTQRLVTTCNGGSGTDWDVPQNWTGTYGGDPNTYAEDVKKQVLIGEFGAWRTLGLHTEGPFVQNGVLSEDRMTLLMEQKIRLAESVKDSSAGQFFWLLTSHDNPGRVQGGEGHRELDRIGPVNYKGLLTPWEEPLDAYYMFRSNYASPEKEPMVYIVSHTWPGRWTKPGKKDSIIVYSNCDEVELFNDVNNHSLGRKKGGPIGTHYQWDNADIRYNILYAVGYVKGKPVARDTVKLHYLPQSPSFNDLYATAKPLLQPASGYNYIYRINCGGPDYTDSKGNLWMEDRPLAGNTSGLLWGSVSWANDFENVPSFFASQRTSSAPVKGTRDWPLFQTFRYGKDKLSYHFPLPDGDYLVELYFMEPWLGVGGGVDASGMRLFDIAVNGKTVVKDLDIWKEAGTNAAYKKIIRTSVKGGKLVLSFPGSRAGQAVISAIAIASLKTGIQPAPSYELIKEIRGKRIQQRGWLDEGDKIFMDDTDQIRSLPSNLFGAGYLSYAGKDNIADCSFVLADTADVFVAMQAQEQVPAWLKDYENTQKIIETVNGSRYTVFRKRFPAGATVSLQLENKPLIMAQAAVDMQPAYDLKPVNSYRTNVAVINENVQKEQLGGREVALVKTAAAAEIEWPVQTGVADIYSITIKYYWPETQPVNGIIELTGPGNSRMMSQPVSFTFTRPGKWNTVTVNTGNMINAGNYTVRLLVEKAERLAVSGIDVQ